MTVSDFESIVSQGSEKVTKTRTRNELKLTNHEVEALAIWESRNSQDRSASSCVLVCKGDTAHAALAKFRSIEGIESAKTQARRGCREDAPN